MSLRVGQPVLKILPKSKAEELGVLLVRKIKSKILTCILKNFSGIAALKYHIFFLLKLMVYKKVIAGKNTNITISSLKSEKIF
jgi:hypothetical protein